MKIALGLGPEPGAVAAFGAQCGVKHDNSQAAYAEVDLIRGEKSIAIRTAVVNAVRHLVQ